MKWFEFREAPGGDFAVVGDPVSHSLSPAIHAAAYKECGLDLRYDAVRVSSGQFALAMSHLTDLGYRGVNVTVPLKEEAFAWCSTVDAPGDVLGVVNTIDLIERRGTNTDAPAFLETLKQELIEPGATVLVLGAGGTARALLPSLVNAGYLVSAWNRSPLKLEDIAAEFALPIQILDDPDPSGQRVIVNSTSASLLGYDLPILWDNCDPNCLAYDVMYGWEPTRFLSAALKRGLKILDGRPMLVEQAALAFEWWTGMNAPRTAMLLAAHEHPEPDA